MNSTHLYTVARLYSVDEGDLVSPERMAKALVRIWHKNGLRRGDVVRYSGISARTHGEIYALAGEPYKSEWHAAREPETANV